MRFDGNVQIALAIKGEPHRILARRELVWPGKNGARSVRSEFIDRWVPTKIHAARPADVPGYRATRRPSMRTSVAPGSKPRRHTDAAPGGPPAAIALF